MEDSMFDEQFVTTAEEIEEAREALIELGKDIAVVSFKETAGTMSPLPVVRYTRRGVING